MESQFLHPTAVTVVGASEHSTASRELIANLTSGNSPFQGRISLVNRRGGTIAGLRCDTSLSAVEEPGIVFLLTSAAGILGALHELRGNPTALLVYAEDVEDAIDELATWAREHRIPVLGPQSAGMVIPSAGMIGWTGALPEPISAGGVVLLSQSGGMLSGLLRRTAQRQIGLRAAFSYGLGRMTSCVDLATTLLGDPATRIVVVYAEALLAQEVGQLGFRAARAEKPLVILNPGISREARSAVESHVGRAATDRQILEGVAEQYGIFLVSDPEDLIWTLEGIVGVGYRRDFPSGVAIVATSGGAGAVAADAMTAVGVPLHPLSDATRARLDQLGAQRAVYNPYDLGAAVLDSDPSAYEAVVRAIASDPGVGIILETTGTGLSFGVPQRMESNAGVSRGGDDRESRFVDILKSTGKVGILASPLAVSDVSVRRRSDVSLLAVTGAHRSAVICRALAQWSVPAVSGVAPPLDDSVISQNREVLRAGVWAGASVQAELESLTVQWPARHVVANAQEALIAWHELDGPAVAKTEASLAHRSIQGGVVTGLTNAAAVAAAVELLLAKFEAPVSLFKQIPHETEYLVGFTRKHGSQFLVFGHGGVLADEKMSMRLCPCGSEDIARLITAHAGLVGFGSDTLIRLITDVQAYAMARPEVSALELNPVAYADDGQLYALDAKMHVDRLAQ